MQLTVDVTVGGGRCVPFFAPAGRRAAPFWTSPRDYHGNIDKT